MKVVEEIVDYCGQVCDLTLDNLAKISHPKTGGQLGFQERAGNCPQSTLPGKTIIGSGCVSIASFRHTSYCRKAMRVYFVKSRKLDQRLSNEFRRFEM